MRVYTYHSSNHIDVRTHEVFDTKNIEHTKIPNNDIESVKYSSPEWYFFRLQIPRSESSKETEHSKQVD